jgi:hypothetical protein
VEGPDEALSCKPGDQLGNDRGHGGSEELFASSAAAHVAAATFELCFRPLPDFSSAKPSRRALHPVYRLQNTSGEARLGADNRILVSGPKFGMFQVALSFWSTWSDPEPF